MKLTIEAFNAVLAQPKYEGADTYLLDDNKEKVPYHIYMCLIESGNVAAIILEKMPATGNTDNYEIYEFNGNKLLEHNVVRVKELSKDTPKFQTLMSRFTNKDFR